MTIDELDVGGQKPEVASQTSEIGSRERSEIRDASDINGSSREVDMSGSE